MVHLSLIYLTISIFIALCFSGCEITSTDDREPALYGTVVDEAGNPLSDVHIHFRLHFEPEEAIPLEDEWARGFRLSIPQPDSVQVDVFRYGTKESVLTLLEGFVNAGQYILRITPYTLTTGLYDLQIVSSDTSVVQTIPVHASNTYLSQTEAFIRSNNQGAFVLEYTSLGIGEVATRLPLTDSSPTALVLPRVSLIAVKEGYVLLETELSILENEIHDMELKMERLP